MRSARAIVLVLIATQTGLCLATSCGRPWQTPEPTVERLTLHAVTDSSAFTALIDDYQRQHPSLDLRYVQLTSEEIYRRARSGAGTGRDQPDLLISSGMDLQTKLVNDGFVQEHRSVETAAVPPWARWRDEAFAFSCEPAVLVYNTQLLSPAQVPRSRDRLLEMLRDVSRPLRARIGTYDVRLSGVGYLLASQDARISGLTSALTAALGDNEVVLEDQSSRLLDRLAKGELALAYNVLGSYAQARIEAGAPLGTVLLEDYTLTVCRVAVIPKAATHVVQAKRFLDYLLSRRGQSVLANASGAAPVRTDLDDSVHARGVTPRSDALRPISLGPGLLVYRDGSKRRAFLAAWERDVRRTATMTGER
jgi:iron(III) transport system substrate-binding protein